VTCCLAFSSLAVALLSAVAPPKSPPLLQWLVWPHAHRCAGVFHPAVLPAAQWFGVIAAPRRREANAISTIVGRDLTVRASTPAPITVVSMGAGSAALLVTGILVEACPHIRSAHLAFILGLAA